jgi:dGTPase
MTLNDRTGIEHRESQLLAPYAAKAAESRGRVYPQAEHPFRTAFQRDRDRIVHSSAFRRMEYKTQVFLPHEGDHFRTRLTHTIEVAQIARTLARGWRLNEDLTEAIALVHDLGHTPFGHAGERVLDDLLADNGGFNHNRQSLRVVDILEQRYPEYPGLNLSYEVREGIVKHETSVRIVHPDFDPDTRPTLEAALVDIADEIAYNGHDVDDGISSGLISLDEIIALKICTPGPQGFKAMLPTGHAFTSLAEDQKRYALVRYLVNAMASDVLVETDRRLKALEVTDLESVRNAPQRVCAYSDEMEVMVSELKSFLMNRLYRHPGLITLTERTEEILNILFSSLRRDPSVMPQRYQEMLLTEETDVVIADYIAGMTDRYAQGLFDKLK